MALHILEFMKRRPKLEPWPRNPRTVADDLAQAQANEAKLADQLRETRQAADQADARAAAANLRADQAEEDARKLRAERDGLRAANTGLQKQLNDALYTPAQLHAIETGTGQPRKP